MKQLRSRTLKASRGFTLFELILVTTVIGVLAASSLIYYEKTLEGARRTGVEVLANRFTAAVALIRGKWYVEAAIRVDNRAAPTWRVMVDNTPIFVNEYGWPANTDGRSAKPSDQTVEECYQIWNGILQNPPPATLEGRANSGDPNDPNTKGKQRYHISIVSHSVCRFELVSPEKGLYAFEYDLRTGRVSIKVPPLE